MLAGVAGGLGDYFGVDPAIFRLAFVALALFGGSGFILYALGWLFLPVRGSTGSLGEDMVRRVGGGRSAGGLVLILIAALVIIGNTRILQGGLVWAAILIGIGVLLFRNGSDDDGDADGSGRSEVSDRRPVPPPMPDDENLLNDPLLTDSGSVDVGDTESRAPWAPSGTIAPERPLPPPPIADDGWRPTPQTGPPEPPRPPSLLGRITVAATLIVIGAVALLENLTPVDLQPAHYFALALTVVGGGLIVGAWFGRAHGLIALGVVGVVGLTAATATPNLPPGGMGDPVHTPQTVAELREPFELGVGEMTIDLTELDTTPGQDIDVVAEMGAGSLQVVVPDDAGVIVDAQAQLGEIDVLGQNTGGSGVSLSRETAGTEGSPTFALDLSVGLGEVVVERAAAGGTN